MDIVFQLKARGLVFRLKAWGEGVDVGSSRGPIILPQARARRRALRKSHTTRSRCLYELYFTHSVSLCSSATGVRMKASSAEEPHSMLMLRS